jgi:O-antigen/teichoic acid export membrane protein
MSAETALELRFGLLASLIAIVWVPLIAFRPLAEAGQRGYVVQAALILQSWLTAGLVIGLAVAGAGLVGQFLAIAIGNGLATLVLLWDALRRYPEIVSRAASMAVLPVAFSGSMFVFNLLSRVGLHSDSIIVGLTLGPTSVVAFTVTQRLLLLVDTQVMALGSATWGALAELHHQGQAERFNHRLVQLTRFTGVLAFGLIIPVMAATRPFVGLWVGAGRYGSDLLVISTAVYVWLHAVAALWGWPLITTGRVRAVLPIYLIGIPLNVAVSIAGSLWIGVAGPAIGSAISIAAVWLWWLPCLLRNEFGTALRPLARAVIRPALLGLPLMAGLYCLSTAIDVHELAIAVWARWFVLASGMMISAMLYFFLAWFLVLPREDRDELRARLFR